MTYLPAGAVVVGPAAAAYLLLAARALGLRRQAEGLPATTRTEIIATLDALALAAASWTRPASADGSTEADPSEIGPSSRPMDVIDTATAADLLGVGARRVVQLAEALGGRKVSREWVFDRAAVVAYRAARRAA